jgi:hypothetical protein
MILSNLWLFMVEVTMRLFESMRKKRYSNGEMSIFVQFLSNGSLYNYNNILFINNFLEKSILNDIGNAVFLKSWEHIVKNAFANDIIFELLGPWLEKLHREGQGQLGHYGESCQLCVMPLVPDDTLYDYVMDRLNQAI